MYDLTYKELFQPFKTLQKDFRWILNETETY